MQFTCHNCRTTVSVSPQGGQFSCPICRAVNVVATPAAPAPASRRPLVVVGAVAVLSIVALVAGWWGVGLGVALLGWSVAGALDRVKGPLALVFPHSGRRLALALGSIGTACLVTTCGVMGVVGQRDQARRETEAAARREAAAAEAEAARQQREAEAAAAAAARDEQLRGRAPAVAAESIERLAAIEAWVAAEQWDQAEAAFAQLESTLADYRGLEPLPDELRGPIQRRDQLAAQLDEHRRARELERWLAQAEAVVADPSKCEDPDEVEQLRASAPKLADGHPRRAELEPLRAGLDTCAANMPPPSQWQYRVREDPMGGVVATASVESSNTFEFEFPYQDPQHAILTIRNDGGHDVILAIERGQFMCSFGCSVLVRFDDGEAQRWRATESSDYDTTVVFLRNETKFIKQLRKARVVRIAAEFYQEGSRVLEFPVARFEPKRIE